MKATEPSDPEVERWLHRLLHLLERQHGHEACLASDQCWSILDGGVPPWALDRLRAGEPAPRWCPKISPELEAKR